MEREKKKDNKRQKTQNNTRSKTNKSDLWQGNKKGVERVRYGTGKGKEKTDHL